MGYVHGINDVEHPLSDLVTETTLLYYPTLYQGDLNEALENNNPVAYIGKDMDTIVARGVPSMQSRQH